MLKLLFDVAMLLRRCDRDDGHGGHRDIGPTGIDGKGNALTHLLCVQPSEFEVLASSLNVLTRIMVALQTLKGSYNGIGRCHEAPRFLDRLPP